MTDFNRFQRPEPTWADRITDLYRPIPRALSRLGDAFDDAFGGSLGVTVMALLILAGFSVAYSMLAG